MIKMNLRKLNLNGAVLIEPLPFKDERGVFTRIFCKNEMDQIFDKEFVQMNHSLTYKKGTFRGLHFQYPPYGEDKIIKCLKGSIMDIIVDIRKGSPTFLQYHAEILSSENMKMIYIPEGFAHGFQTLEDNTELLYLHSEFYIPNSEGALNIKDQKLHIELPLTITEISQRDKDHPFIDISFQGI